MARAHNNRPASTSGSKPRGGSATTGYEAELSFVGRVFAASLHDEDSGQVPAVSVLPASCATDGGEMGLLEGMEGHYVPLSDWIHDTLRPHVERIIPSDDSYSLVFDKLEILMALGYERHRRHDWDRPPVGAFIYRHSNREHIIREIKESLSKMQNESAFVTSDLFGDTEDDCQKNIAALEDAVRSYIGQVGVR